MSLDLPVLAPGDGVRVVLPAGPPDGEALERGLVQLQELGLAPQLTASAVSGCGYLAAPDDHRGADLEDAFAASGSKGVFYGRGGFGTTRLLPRLRLEAMARSGKLLLGYSDATALGLALSVQRPFPYLHGPTVAELGAVAPDHDRGSLKQGLLGSWPRGVQEITGLRSLRPGRAEAIILGGCLSLVVALLGTPFMPAMRGRILFLEEVGEEPYRLDRMLTQLATAGVLGEISGLVIGRLWNCGSAAAGAGSPEAAQVVASFAAEVRGPVLDGLAAGHGPGRQTVPLGVPVEMDATAGVLRFHHR